MSSYIDRPHRRVGPYIQLPDGAKVEYDSDPINDDGSVYPVMVLPRDAPWLGVKIEGDSYARLALGTDPNNFGFLFWGDGTQDPISGGGTKQGAFYMNNAGQLGIYTGGAGIVTDGPPRPGRAAYFNLNSDTLGEGSTLDLPAALGDVINNLSWSDGYQTPDEYWGEDISAVQTALVIPAYGDVSGNGINCGPLLPVDGAQYWFEVVLTFTPSSVPESTLIGQTLMPGNVSGNVAGNVFVNAGESVGALSIGEVVTVLSSGTVGLCPILRSYGGLADLQVASVSGYASLVRLAA